MSQQNNEAKIRQLVELALDRPAPERAAFLDRVCGDTGDIRDRVEALLAAHEEVGDFLAEPTAAAHPPSPDPIPESGEQAGDTIGNYKLLQQIGEGGMGTVWMAEQFEPVRRKVALKIIKLGMDSRQVVVRFEAERQALAMMDHPSIAKVLDGGMTGTGRPYFVMELVKGVTITEFCDGAKYNIRQRLALFGDVCAAVQHAHQKGIIHRDIKPTNVLVTLHDGKPVPKVIDFGIAKATNQELTQKTLFTEYAQILGTPEYMAPEQASMSGLDVDTRADVYSLGVLLYELLTGSKPFDLKTIMTRGYEELLRTIREEDPPRPSTRASATDDDTGRISMARQMGEGQLGKALRGDLDWIVVKAMEKDRTRRYETANGLAADVQRFLDDEPVTATPPSASYRMRKFVKRNKGMVTAASLVFAALLLGIAGTTVGLRRAVAEKQRAELAERATSRELERATEVKGVIKDMIQGIKPEEALGTDTTLLMRIVDRTAERLAAGRIEDEQIAAELHLLVGHAYAALGEYEAAERHLPAAVEIRTRTLGAAAFDTLAARMQLGLLYANQGRVREAAAIQEEILPLLLRHKAPDDREVLGHQVNLANTYWMLNELDKALELGERTHAALRRAFGGDDEFTLNAAGNLALVYRSLGRVEDAARRYEEALEARRRLDGPDHPRVLPGLVNLAQVQLDLQHYDDAGRSLAEARAIADRIYSEDSPNTLLLRVAESKLLQARGRTAEAQKSLEEAIAIVDRTLSPEHALALGAKSQLAAIYALEGRHGDAYRITMESIAHSRRVLGDRSPRAQTFLRTSANTLMVLRRYAEARPLFERMVEVRREQLGDDHEKTLAAVLDLAAVQARTGQLDAAEALLRHARPILEQRFGSDDPRTVQADRVYAALLAARSQWDEAGKLHDSVLARLPEDSMAKAELHAEVAEYQYAAGKLAEALESYRKVAAIYEKRAGPKSMGAILARRSVARLTQYGGRLAAAQEAYRAVIEDMREVVGADHASTIETECMLAISYGAQKNFIEAERILLSAQQRAESQWGRRHLITLEAYRSLGMVYMDWNRLADAERVFKIVVENYAQEMGAPPYMDLERLALCAQGRKDFATAIKYHREALAAGRASLGRDHAALLDVLSALADALTASGDLVAAEETLTETDAMARRILPASHPTALRILRALAGVRQQAGHLEQAVTDFKEFIDRSRAAQGEKAEPALLTTYPLLGIALNELGRFDEAAQLMHDAIASADRVSNKTSPWVGFYYFIRAASYSDRGMWTEAEKEMESARQVIATRIGPASFQMQLHDIQRAQILNESGRPEEALKLIEPAYARMGGASAPPSSILRDVMAVLVRTYDELGMTDKARPLLEKLASVQIETLRTATSPSRRDYAAAALSLLYDKYEKTHDPATALAYAERALAMEEQAKGAAAWSLLQSIARAQNQLGRQDEAHAALERAMQLAPEGRRPELEAQAKKFH